MDECVCGVCVWRCGAKKRREEADRIRAHSFNGMNGSFIGSKFARLLVFCVVHGEVTNPLIQCDVYQFSKSPCSQYTVRHDQYTDHIVIRSLLDG